MQNATTSDRPTDGGAVWEIIPRDGLKDTLDSILIAFILAFVFRGFMVEAFRIPTGSMAPTLYGAHGTIVCDDCGSEFAFGLKDSNRRSSMESIGPGDEAICPNCNHANSPLRINDLRGNHEGGDRILVTKWPFGLGGAFGPSRWDVLVFKNPTNGVDNYIKRLVGLPGEVLMIVDGDAYTLPTEELSEAAAEELEAWRHEKYEFRSGQRPAAHNLRPVADWVIEELAEKMRIAPKTDIAQKSLWFTVYNHDFSPSQIDRNQPSWEPSLRESSGWDATMRKVVFKDQNLANDCIALVGDSLLSHNAYNVLPISSNRRLLVEPVTDLRVQFVLVPSSASNEIAIRLVKGDDTFLGVVRADGSTAIYRSDDLPDKPSQPMLESKIPALAIGEPVEVAFELLDYRLELSVGGQEVLSSTFDKDSPGYYGPDLAKLLAERRRPLTSPPRIYASGGDLELMHLHVLRDVYYVSPSNNGYGFDWAPGCWGVENNPIMLRDGEYFMLGDNSAASQDSRLWGMVGPHLRSRGEAVQLGTVPEDQLVGKAFFVYWPSGLRIDWLPPLDRIGAIPDVGRMRWIR